MPSDETRLHESDASRDTAPDVTRRVQEAAGDDESPYETLFDVAGLGMAETDAQTGRLTRVNEAFCDLTGRSRAALLGLTMADVTHPDDRARDHEAFAQMVRGARARYEAESRYVRPDGQIVRVQLNASPIRDAAGRVVRLAAITRALTAQHLAEAAREHATRLGQFAALVESVDQLVGMCDLEFRPYYVNAAGLRLVGIDNLEQFCQTPESEFFFPEDRAFVFDEFLPRVLRDGHGEIEIRFRHFKTAEPIWVIYSVVRLTNDRGEPIGYGTVTRDITERKRGEDAQCARQRASLQARDRTLGVLLDTAAQGIVSVDGDGRVVVANHALEAMFGWARGELVGRSIEELVPAALRARHAQHRVAYFRAPRTRHIGLGPPLVGQRKDGTTFAVEVSLDYVATDDGGQAIGFVTDVTERVSADVALREAHRRLEQRSHQLSRLASDLTLTEQASREQLAKTLHDGLQQLLFSVRLRLAGLQLPRGRATAGEAAAIASALETLDEAIASTRSLSVELFPPVLHERGLPAALTWLADWMRTKYELVVQVSADPAADPVRKDVRILLFESVRELLFNVVKHAGGADAAVDVGLLGPGELCITVADRGPGIDPAVAFGAAGDAHAGLGLFSIRERLTLLGGHLELDNVPGGGARVKLIAPHDAAQPSGGAPGSNPHESPGDDAGADAPRRTVTVLLVDDHASVRQGLREMLGHHPSVSVVGEAANGREAVEQARALRPDAVVIDVSMPEMDGVEATKRIHAEFPSIRIFGLSTHERTEDLHAIERAGASGYFTKGADAQRLLEQLLAVRPARQRR